MTITVFLPEGIVCVNEVASRLNSLSRGYNGFRTSAGGRAPTSKRAAIISPSLDENIVKRVRIGSILLRAYPSASLCIEMREIFRVRHKRQPRLKYQPLLLAC